MAKVEASRVVWNWRNPPTAAVPPPAAMRRRGVRQGLVGAAVATGVYLLWSPTVGVIGWGLAGTAAALAVLSPGGAYAALERGLGRAARVVGRGLTWLLLTPIYLLFFTPFRLLLRRRARDRLARRFPGGLPSYWVTREAERLPPERYRRLY